MKHLLQALKEYEKKTDHPNSLDLYDLIEIAEIARRMEVEEERKLEQMEEDIRNEFDQSQC